MCAKGPTAVIPVQSSGLNFDTLAHLEYFATVAEQRTGVVRNAQGLNPDTLHDTAKGAEQLMMLAQKRMRMIARTFAETGVKDLFLGVHALLRQHATKQRMARLRNKWVPVDPASWSVRNDMTIEVGLGSSGREHDLLVMDRVTNMQAAIVQAEGGYNGPLVTAQNIYAAAIRASEKAAARTPRRSSPILASSRCKSPSPTRRWSRSRARCRWSRPSCNCRLKSTRPSCSRTSKRPPASMS
ncbi:portal protein [Caulobacter segnis]